MPKKTKVEKASWDHIHKDVRRVILTKYLDPLSRLVGRFVCKEWNAQILLTLQDKDVCACSQAAEGGHLHVLQWLRENGCPWSEWTCAYAAYGGHLHVLRWLRANGGGR